MKRYKGWLLIAILAVLAIVLARPVRYFVDNVVYARHRARADISVKSLAKQRPANVSPEVWQIAEFWMVTSFGNVFVSPEHAPIEELDRFAADIETALTKDVTLETVDWYWHRFAVASPGGQRYFDKFEPEYREQMKAALSKPQLKVNPARSDN